MADNLDALLAFRCMLAREHHGGGGIVFDLRLQAMRKRCQRQNRHRMASELSNGRSPCGLIYRAVPHLGNGLLHRAGRSAYPIDASQ